MGVLELLIVILLILWLVGAIALPVGNIVHLLLVLVVVLLAVRLLRGRKVL